MINISRYLKERFCRDCKLSIRIFEEPYFFDRLILYDKIYKGTLQKYFRFAEEVEKYGGEQKYLTEYNQVKDRAIEYIKESAAYQKFNALDMQEFVVQNKNLPGKDIYSPQNEKNQFISIDMKKANFSALRHFDPSIVGGANTWEEFIGKFTSSEHIKESKYIRQVIFGNCNCKRHITYEKYIMDNILTKLDSQFHLLNRVVFFSNDEIVLKVTDYTPNEQRMFEKELAEFTAMETVPLRVELFTLKKIGGINGYYKEKRDEEGIREVTFKGIDSYYAPFVLRKYLGEEVEESDFVFVHEGILAKFIEKINIVIE